MITKKYLLLIGWLMFSLAAWADVQVTASAPDVVVVGEQFRLSYKVNTQDIDDFSAPAVSGFDILMGPSRSMQSSFQMINGRTTQSSSVTFTYILNATKAGTYTIGPASVTVNGKKHQSNSLRIQVLPPDKTRSNSSSNSGSNSGGGRMHTQDAGSQITGKDLFIAVTASKKRVYEQEAILLTYKVYSLVSLSQLMGDMPDLDGFHTQEIPLPQQKSLKMEHYNGRNYGTVLWRQYVLFPQRSGKLTIPSIKFQAVVVQQNRNIDPFDAFFGGGSAMTEVQKTIVAPALTIQVDPLPEPRPANFSGAVGQFTLKSSLTPKEIKTNDALTLRLTVSGTGNMKLMKAPVVNFPKDFESYDAKTTDNTKIGREGATGEMIFDYLAVPRHSGKYTVPSVEFCYFDPAAKQYKTLKSDSYDLEVAKGKGGEGNSSYNKREDVELLASDIRYIHQGDVSLRQPGDTLFGTLKYALCYLIPLLVFVVLIVIFRKKATDSSNVVMMKHKKANKVAARRMKQAQALLRANKPSEFYEEVLKAMWGYVGDKLNIPVAELNKENVNEKLLQHGVSQETADAFLSVLNDCEFARYAPGDPAQTMDKIYMASVKVMSEMENMIKR
jgi:hypothetical protein